MKTLTTTQKLKELTDAGMTLSEIARATGIPQPTVWRIAHGKHTHPIEKNVMLISALYDQRMTEQLAAG